VTTRGAGMHRARQPRKRVSRRRVRACTGLGESRVHDGLFRYSVPRCRDAPRAATAQAGVAETSPGVYRTLRIEKVHDGLFRYSVPRCRDAPRAATAQADVAETSPGVYRTR